MGFLGNKSVSETDMYTAFCLETQQLGVEQRMSVKVALAGLPSLCNLSLLLLLSHFSHVRLWDLCDPTDGSPQAPIPGILQARTLEWVAISFSNA